MRRSKGFRNKTRKTLRASYRRKITITRKLAVLPIGANVVVDIEPSVQGGMPHPRYQGTRGTVMERRGRAYLLAIHDKDKAKTLISYPEHLKVLESKKEA